VIGTKWVYKNKLNEDGKIIKNKSRLVCKDYAHVEGGEFEEIFSPIARIEVIRMFFSFSCYKNFKVYYMDVKSTFLYGYLEEAVYVEQPKGLLLIEKKDYAC
jgi:hypothetical protein